LIFFDDNAAVADEAVDGVDRQGVDESKSENDEDDWDGAFFIPDSNHSQ